MPTTTQTLPDGTVIQTTTFSDGSTSVTYVPVAGSPALNGQTLRDQATTALTSNRTYLALASPSTAQNTAQVKALTRQMNAVIRLVLGQLDGTD